MSRKSIPPRRTVGFKGGIQDGSDEKEVVPDFEQAGPFFPPEPKGTRQQKKDPPRESTPVELPSLPLDPPSYENVGQIEGKPEPNGTRPSTPVTAPPEPQRVELNINLNVNTSDSSKRPATPAEEEPVPKKDSERNPVKKNSGGTTARTTQNSVRRVEISDRHRKRLEKLAGRRSLWG